MSKKKRHRKAARIRPKPGPPPTGFSRRRAVLMGICAAVAIGVAGWVWLREPDGREATEPPRSGPIRFHAAPSGVDFVLNNGTTDDKPMPDSTLGGVAVLDCDNDGLLDLYFTNGARFPDLVKADPSFHNRLYRNLGDRQFEDVTETAGVAAAGYSMGVATGDYDNDGWTDMYVAGVNRNFLFHNVGSCRFEDATRAAGVSGRSGPVKPWSVAAAWLDYDNDGHLDLFVVNYLDWSWTSSRVCGDPGRRLSCSPAHYRGLPNILYRNQGGGTFLDVSAETGIASHTGKGMSAAVADYDRDGRPDLFVTNDSVRNFLFRNVGGERFEEVGVQAGIAFTGDGIPVSSMGVDFRDLTGDGQPDAIVTALAGETYPLFLSRGNGQFSDETYPGGIGLPSTTMSGWSAGAFDFDNDGDTDIFTANSHVSENVDLYRDVRYRLPNAVFERSPDGTYIDASGSAGAAMQDMAAHRGAAFGDLDNDGRVDAAVSAIGSNAKILFNESGAGNWLLVEVEGTTSNRSGIGARLVLTDDRGRVQHNHVTTAVGYASSSDIRVHFGLGNERAVRRLEIHWPGGTVQVLEDLGANRIVRVAEGS